MPLSSFFYIYTDTKHCLAQAQGHIDNGTFMPYAIGAVLRCLTTAPLLPQGKRKAAETPMMEISAAKVGGDEKGGKTGLQGRENPTGSRWCPIGRKSAQQPDTQQMSRTWHSTRKIVGRRKKRQMGFSRIPFAPFQPPPKGVTYTGTPRDSRQSACRATTCCSASGQNFRQGNPATTGVRWACPRS